MKSKKEIKSIFSALADAHLQINSFGYGQEFEQQAVEGVEYPLMWVVPLSSPLNGVIYSRTYRIVIADRVRKDESDEIDVESDTDQILLDIVAYLYKYGAQNQINLQDGQVIEPFWEKWSDEVTGSFCDVVLDDQFDWDSCSLPIEGVIPSPSGCEAATITINSQSFTTVQSGATGNIIVKDTNGDSVGEKIGSEWIVPAASGSVTTEDEIIEMSFIYGQGISI